MTYDEYVSMVAEDNLVCPKCKNRNWVVKENRFGDSQVFFCKECKYTKEIENVDLMDFRVNAKKILKKALAGDFVYDHQIEDLANDLLK